MYETETEAALGLPPGVHSYAILPIGYPLGHFGPVNRGKLADVPLDARAYTEEIFGPVAPVISFSSVEEAARLAAGTEYGLSLGIVTRDVMRGLEFAEHVPSGLVHINDQTVNDEANIPFGGVGASGTGSRHGGAQANIEAFTETQWVTVRREPPAYPF